MADGQNRPRVLFVDDEPSIRLTLPPVLQEAGFEVRVSESVPDALFEINTNPYDVLISDLNIGEDGDGFLVVSAMRHVQPGCTNFILTGYPAFETALQAIHNQVDDYLVKPVEVGSLIKSVRDKVESRRRKPTGLRLSTFLKENASEIAEHTRAAMQKLGVADHQERVKDHGETLSSLLAGFEYFTDAVYALIQNKLTTADMMNLISDLRRLNRNVSRLMEKSVEAYSKRKVA